MTPIEASGTSNKKIVSDNLRIKRERHKPNFQLGKLVRTADIKSVFSKVDCTNYSYKLYTITEFIPDTIPGYRLNFLHET